MEDTGVALLMRYPRMFCRNACHGVVYAVVQMVAGAGAGGGAGAAAGQCSWSCVTVIGPLRALTSVGVGCGISNQCFASRA